MLAIRSKPWEVTQKQSSLFAVLRPTSINFSNSLRETQNFQDDDNFIFIPLILIPRLLTSQITGSKKQSEAALFAVRVNLPC
jgi:hypothetical protein